MAWPPTLPPATRTNATPDLDNHPGDHNQLANALAVLIAKGTLNPAMKMTGGAINTGSGGGNIGHWYRIGSRVFVDAYVYLGTGSAPASGSLLVNLPFAISAAYAAMSSTLIPQGGGGRALLATPSLTPYAAVLDMTPTVGGASTACVMFLHSTGWIAVNNSHLSVAGANALLQFNYTTDAAP